MVGTSLEFDRFLVILGSILHPFWVIFGFLAPFGLPRGSQGRLPNLAPFLVPFWCPFWLHFGAILAPKTNIFQLKNRIDFLIDF